MSSAKSTKLPKIDAIQLANTARKVPDGWASVQRRIRIPNSFIAQYIGASAVDRGQLCLNGQAIAKDNYVIFYRIIQALGGQIIRTSIDPLCIQLASRCYTGDDHFQLLLTIVEDLLNQSQEAAK